MIDRFSLKKLRSVSLIHILDYVIKTWPASVVKGIILVSTMLGIILLSAVILLYGSILIIAISNAATVIIIKAAEWLIIALT